MTSSSLPTPFKYAKEEASKSTMYPRVGACLVFGKSILVGRNKDKTHPTFANPEKHIRKSLHAELDCLAKIELLEGTYGGHLYVYREIEGIPAMARPCNHCMSFLKEYGIEKIFYTIPHEPFYESEEI